MVRTGLVCKRGPPKSMAPSIRPPPEPVDDIPVAPEPDPWDPVPDPEVEHPIPLEGVNVTATIHGFSSIVEIEQTYVNNEEEALECKYVFPLDDSSAVCKFEAIFDSGAVTGVIQEKTVAKRTYEAAISSGQQAALLEQEEPDIFVVSIGNLKPDEHCMIRITYISEIKMERGAIRFYLPTCVLPPPLPRKARVIGGLVLAPPQNGEAKSETASESAPRKEAETLPYRAAVNLDITMGSNITKIESPSHKVVEEKVSDKQYKVKLADGSLAMDGKEFVLMIEQQEPYGSKAVVERLIDAKSEKDMKEVTGKGSMALQVSFCERTLDMMEAMSTDLPCELIFLVDVSGSMSGAPLEATKNTLQIFLRSLPEKAKFNIMPFSDSFRSCFSSSSDMNDANLKKATAYVTGLKANGGTEILPPLQAIFKKAPLAGYPRQVFVLTDGQVSNTEAVCKEIETNAKTTRVFTFGIGYGVSRPLVDGMAKAGNGRAEFVIQNDKIAEKVTVQLERALQPCITDVSIDWGSAFKVDGIVGTKSVNDLAKKSKHIIKSCPDKLPPMYPGTRYFIYGLVDAEKVSFANSFDIKINANYSRGGKKTFTIPISLETNFRGSGNMIHKLAARARIKELEKGKQDPMTKIQIMALSMQHQISSQHTSFVAVSDVKVEQKEDGKGPAKREVPIAQMQADPEARFRAQFKQPQPQPNQLGGLNSLLAQSLGSRRSGSPSGAGSGGRGGARRSARNKSSSSSSSHDKLKKKGGAMAMASPPSSAAAFARPGASNGPSLQARLSSTPLKKSEKSKSSQKEGAVRKGKPVASKDSASAPAAPEQLQQQQASGGSPPPPAPAADGDDEWADDADDASESDGEMNESESETLAVSSSAAVDTGAVELKKQSESLSSEDRSSVPLKSNSLGLSSAEKKEDKPNPHVAAGGDYFGLIKQQASDGAWTLDDVCAAAKLSVSKGDIQKAFTDTVWPAWVKSTADTSKADLKDNGGLSGQISLLLGTALALTILERCFPHKKSEWSILAMKGRTRGLLARIQKLVTVSSGSVDWNAAITGLLNALAYAVKLN